MINNESYSPMSDACSGLLVSVIIDEAPFCPDGYFETAKILLEAISGMNLTGKIEYYASEYWNKPPDIENRVTWHSGKILFGIGYDNTYGSPDEWQKTFETTLSSFAKKITLGVRIESWQFESIKSMRKKLKCMGVVEYKGGRPIAILDHRPRSPFIHLSADYFENPADYRRQFDPLDNKMRVTEHDFLRLPEKTCLGDKQTISYVIASSSQKRQQQWLDLTEARKMAAWYIFRNKAHFHAWLELNDRQFKEEEYDKLRFVPVFNPFSF